MLAATVMVGAGCGSDASGDETTRDSAGQIVEGGTLDAFEIKVGDCLGASEGGDLKSIEGIPCERPHQSEVYYAYTLPEGDGTFPGTEVIQDAADQACATAFEGYVGVPIESSVYVIGTIAPSEDSWTAIRDREVLCTLTQGSSELTTGSAKGAKR